MRKINIDLKCLKIINIHNNILYIYTCMFKQINTFVNRYFYSINLSIYLFI